MNQKNLLDDFSTVHITEIDSLREISRTLQGFPGVALRTPYLTI